MVNFSQITLQFSLVHSEQDHETPLHFSASWGHTAICLELISHGADINAYNEVSYDFWFDAQRRYVHM